MNRRTKTKTIQVGKIELGGNNHVIIQSMTNTKTKDVDSTVKQIIELEEMGCEIIRVACLDIEDAKAIKRIKKQIHIPIVADIHFDYKIALEAMVTLSQSYAVRIFSLGFSTANVLIYLNMKQSNFTIKHNDRS